MKRTMLSLMLLATAVCGALSQNDAMFIYRNDGEFNAFFKNEIDSIVPSHYDADSVYRAEWQMQVVYTQDSIYRIPIAAIDSVGLVQPETVLQPNVVQMEKVGLMDYLQAVDGMSLLFLPTIPRQLQPRVGEVLLYTDFDSPLLSDGFAGKVLSAKMADDAFRVDCDSIYDIFEIFEQLISIERIVDESASSRRRVRDEWISGRNSLNFNLGYRRSLSDNDKFSLSGSVDGAYIATVTYNITRKEQYIKLKIDHDWQYGAHLDFKHELGSFGPLYGPVASMPAIRFPAVAPVFKFQISGCPFVKGEGNMELDLSFSSPVHSYVGEAVYRNGHFSGWNHKKPAQSSNTPNVEAAFSLNGNVQAGYMVDLWLGLDISIKGIAKDFLKVGTGLDFYIGPQLSGDFSMKVGSENPINYYSIYKDSKIGIDWLHVDYEFFGEASLAGHKFPKAAFCDGSLQSPLNHEWYIMPEFSELTVVKDHEKKQATISTTPSRDILFPLSVGMGLYDSDGKLLSTKYESNNYKRENEGFEIEQTFSSLELGKEYTAKPFIKILGGEVPALPEESFELELPPLQFEELMWADMQYANDNVYVTMLAAVEIPTGQDVDLSTYESCGVCVTNYITGWEYYYDLQENGSMVFWIPLEIPRDEFEKDYDSFTATCDKILFSTYAVDEDGIIIWNDERVADIMYDVPPSVTYTKASITGTQVIERDEDNRPKRYRTSYSFGMDIKGAFWISAIQYRFYSTSSYGWNGSTNWATIPGDASYSSSNSIEYDADDKISHTKYIRMQLTDGSTLNSTNSLVIGGVPSNPTIHIGGEPSQAPAINVVREDAKEVFTSPFEIVKENAIIRKRITNKAIEGR